MDAGTRELERRALTGDLEAYLGLAAQYERMGFPEHAYLLLWWAKRKGGIPTGTRLRELGRALWAEQRGILDPLGRLDGIRVAYKATEAPDPTGLTWEWRTIRKLPKDRRPILAVLGGVRGGDRLELISRLSTVFDLRLCKVPHSASGWSPLRNLACLTRLDVESSSFPDTAVDGIATLSSLRLLTFYDCDKLTPDGVARLMNCGIRSLHVVACRQLSAGSLKEVRKRLTGAEFRFRLPRGHEPVSMKAFGYM